MNNTVFSFIITTIAAGAILTGFDSSAGQDEGEQRDPQKIMHSSLSVEHLTKSSLKQEQVKEWKKLWIEGQDKIMTNTIRIGELREKLEKREKTFDDLYLTRIEKIEIKNESLQSTLETYDLSEGHWESFKRQFHHDMIELSKALADISRDYTYE